MTNSWTQASVRTTAAAMFLRDDELAFLDNIGFISTEGQYCPVQTDAFVKNACTCDPLRSQSNIFYIAIFSF